MSYTWKEFLGSKTVVSEAYVQQRINDWRPGRYDISKAPVKRWKANDPELISKYQADWDDIHGGMGILPKKEENMTICDKFYLVAAEKVRHMKGIYGDKYREYCSIGASKSLKKAAMVRMEECLEWASEFSHIDKEDIRNSWNKEMLSGRWRGGYIKDDINNTSIGKERMGGKTKCK